MKKILVILIFACMLPACKSSKGCGCPNNPYSDAGQLPAASTQGCTEPPVKQFI